jgi:hypothetical protein
MTAEEGAWLRAVEVPLEEVSLRAYRNALETWLHEPEHLGKSILRADLSIDEAAPCTDERCSKRCGGDGDELQTFIDVASFVQPFADLLPAAAKPTRRIVRTVIPRQHRENNTHEQEIRCAASVLPEKEATTDTPAGDFARVKHVAWHRALTERLPFYHPPTREYTFVFETTLRRNCENDTQTDKKDFDHDNLDADSRLGDGSLSMYIRPSAETLVDEQAMARMVSILSPHFIQHHTY